MVKARQEFSWLPCGVLALVLAACGSGGTDSPNGVEWPPPLTVTEDIARGPRLDMSKLSPIAGAEDNFSPDVVDALVRAARAVPNGASQSSRVDEQTGKTKNEWQVSVAHNNDGHQVYRLADGSRYVLVPSSLPRQDVSLALFTDLIPGIEPDLSSYPHELLGIWARDDHVGTFWSRSPSLDPFDAFPSGSATYRGDAVGFHAADGATSKFLAKVTLNANFDDFKVHGTVSGFRLSNGNTLGDFTVNLGETDFSRQGKPFSGDTTADTVAGSGKWGARWSDDQAGAMGGTFGFAADDKSVAVLGAFTGGVPHDSPPGGNPDDPVATSN